MNLFRPSLWLAVLLVWLAPGQIAFAEARIAVLSSIKPLQLLVSAVGGDKVDSQLLLPPGFSPHDARLKPSQWQQLKAADLRVWVGPELESFLESAVAERSPTLRLGQLTGIDMGVAPDNDPHIWMRVDYAARMATAIAEALARLEPTAEAYFLSRAARLCSALRREHVLLKQRFPSSPAPYLLPHQGYSHFESQYGLRPAALVSPQAEQMPGTAHIVNLRERLQAGEFACVYREPQHESKLMRRLLDGIEVQQIALDPMGREVADGDFVAYYRLLAEAFLACQNGAAE